MCSAQSSFLSDSRDPDSVGCVPEPSARRSRPQEEAQGCAGEARAAGAGRRRQADSGFPRRLQRSPPAASPAERASRRAGARRHWKPRCPYRKCEPGVPSRDPIGVAGLCSPRRRGPRASRGRHSSAHSGCSQSPARRRGDRPACWRERTHALLAACPCGEVMLSWAGLAASRNPVVWLSHRASHLESGGGELAPWKPPHFFPPDTTRCTIPSVDLPRD